MFKNVFSYYKFNINYSLIYNKILEECNKYSGFYNCESKEDMIRNMRKKLEIINYYNDIIIFQYHYNNSDKNNDKKWKNYFNN